MKLREHRGSLADSLGTAIDIEGRSALVKHIQDVLEPFGIDVKDSAVSVTPYADNGRVDGWANTHIVTVAGYGVFGFTDADFPSAANTEEISNG